MISSPQQNPKSESAMKKIVFGCLLGSFAVFASGQSVIFDFDGGYSVGDLNGQPVFDTPQWSAPAQATIATDPTGGTTNFSGQVLSLAGSPVSGQHMDAFANISFGGTPSYFSMDLWKQPGIDAHPSELFVRFNGWSSYFAVKLDQDLIEFPGTSLTDLNLPVETVFKLSIDYNVVGGFATSADVYLDGVLAGTASGFNIDMSAGSIMEVRSQKTLTYVDNIAIPEPSTYALLFGVLALAFVVYRCRTK